MTPETDFDQIALRLTTQNGANAQIAIAEQLRQVWNARGAADLATINTEVPLAPPLTWKRLQMAIRGLDR